MSVVSRELRSFSELEALADPWRALWARQERPSPFQSPDWLLPWWQAFAPGELRSIAVLHDGHLAGLAPLYQESSATGRRLLPLGISLSDYLDVLTLPACAPCVLDAIARHLSRMDCDTWEFTDLIPGANALRLPAPSDASAVEQQETTPVLSLDGGPEAAVPAGQRRKWRMAEHRAARRGDVRISAVTMSDAEAAFAALVDLHRQRWESRGTAGVLADPRVLAFHRRALPRLLASGIVRLFVLSIGKAVAGVYYGFQVRDRAFAYLGGFDPAFAYESPGTLLIGHAIATAAAEGAREFHFLRGREAYKYKWGAVDRWTSRRTGVCAPAHAPAF